MAKTGKNITDRLGNSEGAARISGVKGTGSGVTRPRPRPGTGKAAPAPSGNVRPQARPAGKNAATKTVSSPATASVSGRKASGGAPATRPRSRSQAGQEPFRSTRDVMAERRIPVEASRPQTRPQARPERSVSYSRWKDMSRAERRAAGLPLSDMPEAAYNQAMSRR